MVLPDGTTQPLRTGGASRSSWRSGPGIKVDADGDGRRLFARLEVPYDPRPLDPFPAASGLGKTNTLKLGRGPTLTHHHQRRETIKRLNALSQRSDEGRPRDIQMVAAMNPLIAVIVGGVLALVGSFCAKLFEERLQARALRGAFRAEIAGLLEIAAIRKHEEVAAGFISAWKANNPVPFFAYGMELASRNPVFSANVGRIGSIGRELAEEVTAF